MKVTLILAAAISFGMTGCKKEETPASKTTNAAAAARQNQNPLTAPLDYLGAVGQAKRVAQKTVDLASVNRAIQLFHEQEDRYPRNLEELVAQHYLQGVPPAQPGMRISYNPSTGEVKFVRQ